MIGLCGAHRTGKSTLAKAFAERYGVPYVPTGASATYERLGMSPKVDYDFTTRLMIQEEILKDCEALYKAAGVSWITDRTPIDFMMYTLADVRRENVTAEEAHKLDGYIERCFDMTNRHFTVIVVVQPGIPLIDEAGKAPANTAYMEHCNSLALGLANDERLHVSNFYLERDLTNLEKRINAVNIAVNRAAQRHKQAIEGTGVTLH